MPRITFNRQKISLEVKEGTELSYLSFIDSTVPLKFGCRQGHCGVCKITVISGKENLSPETKQEKETLCRLKLDSHRLACQCAVMGEVIIE